MAKLVDILARDLEEWPSQYELIIQDEGGHLHGCYSISGDDTDQEDLPFDPVEVAWDGAKVQVTRAEWQTAVDALNKPGVVEWDGVGLPPVGAILGFRPKVGENREWITASVKYAGKRFLVVDEDGEESSLTLAFYDFRPTHTPEQIAAEDRESAVREMLLCPKSPLPEAAAYALYDAGYRKQAQP